jgi:DNA adenine methylase
MAMPSSSLELLPSVQRSEIPEVPQIQARPFVKWVGGKTQLIPQLDSVLPKRIKSGTIKTYIEPFVGGGALFFHIAQTYHIERFILADNNIDLILAYWTIRERVGQVITALHDLQTKYINLPEPKREEQYYNVRKLFNETKSHIDPAVFSQSWVERTVQLIFLNKTCFNGLFRVNSAGQFNVAFGKYDNPKICDADNLVQVSNILRRAQIMLCDFQGILSFVDENSFVYIDPPYRPISTTANFTAYSASTFTALDQQRLANFCAAVSESGANQLISNSDPANHDPEDRFFEHNYPGFRIVRTSANRMINCKADKRGKINELMILNY